MNFPTDASRLALRERPGTRPVMAMKWERLLFLHWSWDAAEVQRTLPPGLTVDTFDGRAWLGVVPFFMCGVRPTFAPAVPGLSDFLELNVRTYVFDEQGRPGVWFYSLDANQWLAVKTARALFHLNYQHATMSAAVEPASGEVDYRARRRGHGGTVERESRFRYRAVGEARVATAGSLEFFLVERYLLFAFDERRGRLGRGRVWHRPYEISAAEVPLWDDVNLRLAGFAAPARAPDHVGAARRVEVEAWPLEFL